MKKIMISAVVMIALSVSNFTAAMQLQSEKKKESQINTQVGVKREEKQPILKNEQVKPLVAYLELVYQDVLASLEDQRSKNLITQQGYENSIKIFKQGIEEGINQAKNAALYPPIEIPPMTRYILDKLAASKRIVIGSFNTAKQVAIASTVNIKQSGREGAGLGLVPFLGLIALFDEIYQEQIQGNVPFNERAILLGKQLPKISAALICQYLEWQLIYGALRFIGSDPARYLYVGGFIIATILFYYRLRPMMRAQEVKGKAEVDKEKESQQKSAKIPANKNEKLALT